MILDDFEYYQYHKVNYTQAINYMTSNVNLVNKIRFNSWFLGSNIDFRGEDQNMV